MALRVAAASSGAMDVSQMPSEKHAVLCNIFRDHDPGYLMDIVEAVCAHPQPPIFIMCYPP